MKSWKLASAYLKLSLQHVAVVLSPAGCPATQSHHEGKSISSPQTGWYKWVLPQSKVHTIGVYVWIDLKIWIKPESAGAATHVYNETQMCQNEMGKYTGVPALGFQERFIKICKLQPFKKGKKLISPTIICCVTNLPWCPVSHRRLTTSVSREKQLSDWKQDWEKKSIMNTICIGPNIQRSFFQRHGSCINYLPKQREDSIRK